MSYELESFRIKVILIEPGFVKTNFQQAMIRSQDSNSPDSQMMQKSVAVSNQLFQSGSAPELVAVLKAINTPNPNLRYLAGKDVEEWLPEVLHKVQLGHRIFIDDGKIESVVISSNEDYLLLKVVSPYGTTAKIKTEKGLNFPDSELSLSAITSEDIENLNFIVNHATAVALSFVHSHKDIQDLYRALEKIDHADFGIIAKIETRNAIHNLSKILMSGLDLPKFGVLIARGDLAVEIGFENLSLVQEDILCLCEAAHIPVILATQILETLAKSGVPTRAEITDAAMGYRAECVMLNKGKHVLEAVKILSFLLGGEEKHHIKKREILRDLTTQYGFS